MRFPTRELPPIHVSPSDPNAEVIYAELRRLACEATSSRIIRTRDGSMIHVFAMPQGG